MIIYHGKTTRGIGKHAIGINNSVTITQTIFFEVDLDVRQLYRMARKAMDSKGKKSSDGALTLKVTHAIQDI